MGRASTTNPQWVKPNFALLAALQAHRPPAPVENWFTDKGSRVIEPCSRQQRAERLTSENRSQHHGYLNNKASLSSKPNQVIFLGFA